MGVKPPAQGEMYFNRLGKPDGCAFPYIPRLDPIRWGRWKHEEIDGERRMYDKMIGKDVYREIYDGIQQIIVCL